MGFKFLTGSQKPARVDTRTVEFFSISTEDELESESPDEPPKPWELYAIRFSRSAQAAGFTKTVADGLMAALYEMTRNALEHAESPASRPRRLPSGRRDGSVLRCRCGPGRPRQPAELHGITRT